MKKDIAVGVVTAVFAWALAFFTPVGHRISDHFSPRPEIEYAVAENTDYLGIETEKVTIFLANRGNSPSQNLSIKFLPEEWVLKRT